MSVHVEAKAGEVKKQNETMAGVAVDVVADSNYAYFSLT